MHEPGGIPGKEVCPFLNSCGVHYPATVEGQAQYRPGDGNTEVYHPKNAGAVSCSFTEAPKTIRF